MDKFTILKTNKMHHSVGNKNPKKYNSNGIKLNHIMQPLTLSFDWITVLFMYNFSACKKKAVLWTEFEHSIIQSSQKIKGNWNIFIKSLNSITYEPCNGTTVVGYIYVRYTVLSVTLVNHSCIFFFFLYGHGKRNCIILCALIC